MDPRRARDPRLARADPRLQSLPPIESTFQETSPTAVPTHDSQYNVVTRQWSETKSVATLPDSQYLSQFQPANPPTELTVDSSLTPSTSKYKPRPLFCVVCASNQASNCHLPHSLSGILKLVLFRIGPWKDIMFCRLCLTFGRYFLGWSLT